MEARLSRGLPFHYGWIIVFAGTLTVFVGLGLGRFALGMLLPAMGNSIGLNYAEMGFIGTANFIGYLAAVVVSGYLTARLGARKLIFAGLMVVAVTMMLISRAQGFHEILVIFVLTGIGSGTANVPVMGLVSHWFGRSKRGKAAGFIVIGSGFAIVFSGILVPVINGAVGAEGWRVSWFVLGAISLLGAAICGLLLRDRPSDLGLIAIGSEERKPGHSRAEASAPNTGKGVIFHLGAIYFMFGYTYPIYVTFIVTTLVHERGFPESVAGEFWAWIGFLSLFSGPLFGTLSDRLGRRAGMMLVFALHTVAYLLVAGDLPNAFLYLSIGMFGISAWSIPSIMAATVGDYMGPERAAVAFGMITFIFGIGQISGPAIAGIAAEAAGSFSVSFLMAAAMAATGIVLALFLRRPPTAV